ncbi:MAG: PPOX class F420-dependent oxidoreductase [Chloroflexi bacterium]|nr:PPOX class F420-dependent oxidoreductase [Chloroflexota bacterium]
MALTHEQALEFVRRNSRAVLATIKRDGRPQLSNVVYTLDDDGLIKISVTRDRAKTRNVLRDPRASLSIVADTWSDYLVVEGTCAVRETDVLPELRHIYERIRGGPHPNWQEFDAAMVRDGRVVLAITVDRLYPLDRS